MFVERWDFLLKDEGIGPGEFPRISDYEIDR
jgi:hypothetical protein